MTHYYKFIKEYNTKINIIKESTLLIPKINNTAK